MVGRWVHKEGAVEVTSILGNTSESLYTYYCPSFPLPTISTLATHTLDLPTVYSSLQPLCRRGVDQWTTHDFSLQSTILSH